MIKVNIVALVVLHIALGEQFIAREIVKRGKDIPHSQDCAKAAQKELSKMRDLLNRKLIPEMDELDKEIEARGFNTILDRHPSLLDIMTNRENIRKEIEVWRTKH